MQLRITHGMPPVKYQNTTGSHRISLAISTKNYDRTNVSRLKIELVDTRRLSFSMLSVKIFGDKMQIRWI